MNDAVMSMFWYKFLWKHVFSVTSCISLGVELLDHVVILHLSW